MEKAGLDWIPRPVRDKLDQVGIKLHLKEWQALRIEERQELCTLPCRTPAEKRTFQERLDTLALQRCGALPRRIPQKMGEEA